MVSRRNLLKYGAMAGAAAALRPWEVTFPRVDAAALAPSASGGMPSAPAGTPNISQFTEPLPAAIPILTPDTTAYPGADYYEITMKDAQWQFHSQLGAATTWGYWGGDVGLGYLGPTIEATKDRPVVVKYINKLPSAHPVQASIDTTLDGNHPASDYPVGRATPHLHGGFTPPQFDGHPYSWFDRNGKHDPAVKNSGGSYFTSLTGNGSGETINWYSNQQPAAMLWYHDHAFGITRLNAYAGLAALYFIRDDKDTGKANNPLGLPAGAYEIPLVIQDKQFNANGTLFYPTTNDQPTGYPHPKWVPEFFGDTPVINAKAYPNLVVEPRRYRFRLLNGSQARFFNLAITGTNAPRLTFYLIGTEQSLLPKPVALTELLLAPAERADIIMDFAQVKPGTTLLLKNNAKAPYPGGGARPGGPMIANLMQFQVTAPLQGTDTTMDPAKGQLVLPTFDGSLLGAAASAPRRQIIMKELMYAPTDFPIEVKLNERSFDDKDTSGKFIFDETPPVGATEVWEFVNCTGDAHPMHMHLVKFQVVGRYTFDADEYFTDYQAWIDAGRDPATKPDPRNAKYAPGPIKTPAPEEAGWKDTAKAYPGQVLRIVAKFDLPLADPNITGTATPLPAEYVYHCHILEHEENEMMRTFAVGGAATPAAVRAAAPAGGAASRPVGTATGGTAPARAPAPRTSSGPTTSGATTGPAPAPLPASR